MGWGCRRAEGLCACEIAARDAHVMNMCRARTSWVERAEAAYVGSTFGLPLREVLMRGLLLCPTDVVWLTCRTALPAKLALAACCAPVPVTQLR